MTDRDPEGSGRQAALRVAARLREDLERQINAVDQTVRELAATVAKLGKGAEEKDDAGPQPFWPADLDPDDWAEKRADLEQWVADVLAATHPDVAGRLPDCWEQHPAALEAVLAAYFAWIGAYRAKGRRADDPARWLRDVLPALDSHLEAEFQPKPGARARIDTRTGPSCTNPDHRAPRSTP